jgi:hypothetical protein
VKRLLLAGVAALFLATGAAHAQWRNDPPWRTDCRHGLLEMYFEPRSPDDFNPPVEFDKSEAGRATVIIDYEAFRKLLKDLPTAIRAFKACDAYRKCLDDRGTGKVKHCYWNDRRWREFYTGAW